LEEMQAILVADYSFTPIEYWRGVSLAARQFIKRCLTIDPTQRMTAHEALSHQWIAGPESGRGEEDLLPTVKKNFNARRTLHKAIDTVRAINQLRAGGMGMIRPPLEAAQERAAQGGGREFGGRADGRGDGGRVRRGGAVGAAAAGEYDGSTGEREGTVGGADQGAEEADRGDAEGAVAEPE